MNLCILLEDRLLPIPNAIETIATYGTEHVRFSDTELVRGTAVVLRGEPEDFKTWLAPYTTAIISDSPATGKWKRLTLQS